MEKHDNLNLVLMGKIIYNRQDIKQGCNAFFDIRMGLEW